MTLEGHWRTHTNRQMASKIAVWYIYLSRLLFVNITKKSCVCVRFSINNAVSVDSQQNTRGKVQTYVSWLATSTENIVWALYTFRLLDNVGNWLIYWLIDWCRPIYYGSYDNPPRAPLSTDLFWYFLVVWGLYNRFIQCFHPKSCPLVFWGMLFPSTVNFHIFRNY